MLYFHCNEENLLYSYNWLYILVITVSLFSSHCSYTAMKSHDKVVCMCVWCVCVCVCVCVWCVYVCVVCMCVCMCVWCVCVCVCVCGVYVLCCGVSPVSQRP